MLTSRDAQPRRDWLHAENGYVNTSRARAKVAGWFKGQARDQNVLDGKGMVESEIKRLGLQKLDILNIAKELGFSELEGMHAALGSGSLRITQVVRFVQKQLSPEDRFEDQLSLLPSPQVKAVDGSEVYINGVGKLLSSLAPC